MGTQNTGKNVVIIIAVAFSIIAQSGNVYAWNVRKAGRHQDKRPRRVVSLPSHHNTIYLSGISYYYHEGVFYRKSPSKYVFVNAPIGAVVPALPSRCETIIINGTPYYTYDNVYYIDQPSGYSVVPAPVVTTPAPPQPLKTGEDTYVINVPNANGSYTPIVIRKEDDAYVGPQGEYYAQQPTIEQLKAMYAK